MNNGQQEVNTRVRDFIKHFLNCFFFLNRMLAKLIGFVLGMSVCRAVQGLYIYHMNAKYMYMYINHFTFNAFNTPL